MTFSAVNSLKTLSLTHSLSLFSFMLLINALEKVMFLLFFCGHGFMLQKKYEECVLLEFLKK